MPIRFAMPQELPEGFTYKEAFLSDAEEMELVKIFRTLQFAAYDYHGYMARRRIVRYGANYDLASAAERDALPIPDFLLDVRERAAGFAGLAADDMVQAMVSEYSPGTPIGWHRDAPQFGVVIGISLGSACRMRLKPLQGVERILSLRLDPRSIYVIRGPARSEWQHSIPAVEQLRYSITFRTLRKKPERAPESGGQSAA